MEQKGTSTGNSSSTGNFLHATQSTNGVAASHSLPPTPYHYHAWSADHRSTVKTEKLPAFFSPHLLVAKTLDLN